MLRRTISFALAPVLFLLVATLVVPSVAADAVYHTEHMLLLPVGNTTTGSGFVVNMHPNGPQIFAHERYVLTHAQPNTIYVVNLLVYPFDPACSGSPVTGASTELQTNPAGNGTADLVIRPSAVPAALRDATHGVAWAVTMKGTVVYQTACTQVTLD